MKHTFLVKITLDIDESKCPKEDADKWGENMFLIKLTNKIADGIEVYDARIESNGERS